MTRYRDEGALKPIGMALTAVVAGLGAAAAAGPHAMEATQTRALTPDATLDPALDEDPSLILGPSTPIEPFAEQEATTTVNLFDL